MKVKIIQKGWAGFTGNLGTARFVDGVADIAAVEANRIGALVQIARVDDEGHEGHTVSPSADIVRTKGYSAEVQESRKPEFDPEVLSTKESQAEEDGESKVRYSRAQLEAIADEGGIKGIREISTPLGVKGTSISSLIEEILQRLGE